MLGIPRKPPQPGKPRLPKVVQISTCVDESSLYLTALLDNGEIWESGEDGTWENLELPPPCREEVSK